GHIPTVRKTGIRTTPETCMAVILTVSPATGDNQRQAKPMQLQGEVDVEFTIKSGTPEKLTGGTVVVGAFADVARHGAALGALDTASEGRLSALLKRGDLEERAGSLLSVPDLSGTRCDRVLIVSLGKSADYNDKTARDVYTAVAR